MGTQEFNFKQTDPQVLIQRLPKKKKTFKNSGKIVPMSPAYKKATRERISEIITEASI